MAPPTTTAIPGEAHFSPTVHNQQCGFEGNSDMYGFGIRLGIYMQWVAAILGGYLHPQGLRPLMNTYAIFIFAIFVAILDLTAEARPTYAAEMLVLTYIIFGGFYTILWSPQPIMEITLIDRATVVRISRCIGNTLLFGAITAYSTWFWSTGIYTHSFMATPCGTYAFLFLPWPLYSPLVIVVFCFVSISASISAIVQPLPILLDLWEYVRKKRLPTDESTSWWERTMSRWRRLLAKQLHAFKLPVFAAYSVRIFCLVYSILGIELTLYWNGVTDVYSVNTTGQLIPLAIGACGLAQFMYIPAVEYIVKRVEDWERSLQNDVEVGDLSTTESDRCVVSDHTG